MKINHFSCFFLALAIVFFGGCTNTTQSTGSQQNNPSKIVVGFSLASLLEDRWVRDRDIFMAQAQQEGIEVIVKNANMDPDLQYQQVLEMLDQGIDVLLLTPSDMDKNVLCVEAAKKKGVPVISYDRIVRNANVDVFLSFDNQMVGKLMAECLIAKAPTGGYVFINGSPDDYNSTMIKQGYMSILQSKINAHEIEVLDDTQIQGWVRDSAYNFATETINYNGNRIDAVICANDALAGGFIDALNESKVSKVILIVGMDADLVACRRVVQGQQLMTVYKPIKNLVAKAVEICIQLANNQIINGNGKINDGTFNVPYVAIDVIAVTQDNVEDTVIKDGFHLKEEIYSKPDSE